MVPWDTCLPHARCHAASVVTSLSKLMDGGLIGSHLIRIRSRLETKTCESFSCLSILSFTIITHQIANFFSVAWN